MNCINIFPKIDENGNPYLVIKQHDKSELLEEEILKMFCKKALVKGINLE